MNSLPDTLNLWADHALRFVWPMLWQSSLLIGVLFALDLALRRKLRLAVRYALWLIVLVKVLLPPSLAFPTGPGWWLRQAKAAPASPRPITTVVVTYDTHDLPAPSFAAAPVFIPPPPPPTRLMPASWALVGMTTVSLGLLAWMLGRWYRVARDARRAAVAPAWVSELLPEAHRLARLRLTDLPQSPAVCGLFRPVVLLPRSLVEQLPPAQLRAVLLHEWLHLRRGDVWVNCAQALVQILYWWHPLLWFANVRIRLVREEAVDDAVMLALKEEAENYAPTLLEVAKLALHRPLVTLGLVGILESRSSLRQRIERLLDFRPPRKAGLTLGSALAVLGFAALAVPMGEAPPPKAIPESAANLVETNTSATTVSSAIQDSHTPPLHFRAFKVDTNSFYQGLQRVGAKVDNDDFDHAMQGVGTFPRGNATNSGSSGGVVVMVAAITAGEVVSRAAMNYFQRLGADLDSMVNPGKALFFNDRQSKLLVRGTAQDLDIVEQGIAALGVAMEQAPKAGAARQSTASQQGTNDSASNGPPSSGVPPEQRGIASTLVREGKLLYEMGKRDEAEAKLRLALKTDPRNEAANYYLNLVTTRRDTHTVEQAWANPIKRELLPVPNPHNGTNLVHNSLGRQAIITKLDRIRLDSVSFNGLPLIEVVRFLGDESRKHDPQKQGINFLVNQSIDSGATAAAATLGPDGQPLPTSPAEQVNMGAIVIKINPPLTNMRLADVLDAIVKVADQPIKYSIEDYAIVFSPKGHETPPLYTRTFKVDPSAMLDALHLAKGPLGTNGPGAIGPALLDFLAKAGVDLDPRRNPGNAFFYSERNGMLLVRGTLQDLDIIEQMLGVLNMTPPQVNLKVKIVEIIQDDTKASGFDWYLGNVVLNTNSSGGQAGVAPSYSGAPTAAKPLGVFPGNPLAGTAVAPGANAQPLTSGLRSGGDQPFTLTGILTDPQYRMVIKAIQQRNGTEFLAKPEVTSVSGRQVRCKSMSIQTVVKGIKQQALTPPGITSTNDDVSAVFETEPMEFGPILDAVPTVMADGYTINLPVDVTVLGFEGYDNPGTNRVAVYLNGKQKWVAPPQPKVQKRQVAATVNVWDGQTVVLGGLISAGDSNSTQKRNLIVFVTPTLIDPAGNRLHTDDEMPFSRNGIPPQPTR